MEEQDEHTHFDGKGDRGNFQSLGYLAEQLYVIFTTPTHGLATVMENLRRHLSIIRNH
jgi:hypothetical protein